MIERRRVETWWIEWRRVEGRWRLIVRRKIEGRWIVWRWIGKV